MTKKEQAKKLADIIDGFNRGLPSDVFTDLHNASYSLRKWAESED